MADDLTGTVTEKSGVSNGTAGVATATGDLSGFYTSQSNVAKTYGTFSLTSFGGWTYTLDDTKAAVQALNVGGTLHETITVSGSNGNKTIDVTINGANDAAVITGTSTGSVTEKSGVNNGTAGTATATGDLNATDVDSATTFTVQSSVAKTYGTFSIASNGNWTYTLDDNNAAVQALNTGGTLHELVTATSADGTAKTIDITINGANDKATITGTSTGSVTEKSGVANGTAGVATASGTLSAADVDNAATFTVQSSVAKTYGTFSIDSAGNWTYTLNDNNSSVQALNTGVTLHDIFNAASIDGTTKSIDITINGANDAATFSDTMTGSVTEKSGVNNGTAGVATVSADIDAADVDSATTFVTQSSVAKTYGTFTIASNGNWSYTLDDNNASVQALNTGGTLHEQVTVATADGTTQVIDVTINGANDKATITGTTTGSVTEKSGVANGTAGVATATGALVSSDVDNPATFAVQSSVAKSYGTFSIDVDGAWTYTLNDSNSSVQALNTGGTLHDIFTAASVDGTTKSIDITINGANDAATLGGTVTGSVTEKSGVNNGTAGTATASGTATVVDPDSATTFVAQTGVAKTYGTFTINSAGAWSYTLNDNNASVQALNTGGTLHELVTVVSADGSSNTIDVTINGANDSATVTGTTTGSVTEKSGVANGTAGVAAATGTLVSSDIDNPATFTVQSSVAKTYGTFSIDSAGAWSYTLNDSNASVQALNTGGTLHDIFTAASIDGTTKSIDITINGANDTSTVTGTVTGSVTEKSGVNNGTAGVATATGDVDATDPDSTTTLVVQSSVAKTYGTFSIASNGNWTYTLNDNNATVQALNTGGTLHELVTVTASDGATGQIDVTINGANDAATITGTTTGAVTEKSGVANGTAGVATATGDLNATDIDSATTFTVQSSVAKTYGTFSIDSAGAWSYTLNDSNASVQALNTGGTLHDIFTAASVDGTTKSIDITINGANDSAVISGTTTGSVTEKGGFGNTIPGVATATGTATVTDPDNPLTFVTQSGVAKTYGTFTINSAGAWSYTLNDSNATVQALNDGDTLHEMVTVASADGTTKVIDITINGADDSGADLTHLTTALGFIIQGDAAGDNAGFAVAAAGDVNGDGFADLIVGARYGDDGGSKAGEAYVVFGKATGFGSTVSGRSVIDLTSLSAANGFIIRGDTAGDQAGWSVSSAGDLNGDGFADLVVGAPYGDDGGSAAGEAYVVFGKATGFGTASGARQVIDLTSLAVADGFIIQGDGAGDQAGWSVASAGDLNGDGFADLIVGARYGDDGGADAGESYVVFGKASGFGSTVSSRQVLDLTNLSTTAGFIIQGDKLGDAEGASVSSAGDLNGDGFDDLVVGAFNGDDGGSDAGEAYVVFGKTSGFGSTVSGRSVIDLTSLSAANGFIVRGDVAGDNAGRSVASAGDVNGDGFGDLIIGAPGGDDGGNYAGEAYVVFGKASGFGSAVGARSVIDLTKLASGEGFILHSNVAWDAVGWSVASAGDFNGDGFGDLIVGTPYASGSNLYSGEAYVIFGKASGFGTLDSRNRPVIHLENLDMADGFLIQGDGDDDLAGNSVAAAGDVNGDGFGDLIVGAPYGSDGGSEAGEGYVMFGGAFGGSTTPVTLTGTAAAEILIGGLGNDTLTGGGGADSIRGGAGDDILTVSNLSFRSVDGGGGDDKLVLLGAGQNFNFTTLANNKISGIETVDITGSGNNNITLGFADILSINDGDNAAFQLVGTSHGLVVAGNAGDTCTLQSYDPDGAGGIAAALWTQAASNVGLDGTPGGGYNIYELMRAGDPLALVAIETDVTKI